MWLNTYKPNLFLSWAIWVLLIIATSTPNSSWAQTDQIDWVAHRIYFDSLAHSDQEKAKIVVDSMLQLTGNKPETRLDFYALYNHGYYAFLTHHMELSRARFNAALELAAKNGWQREIVDSKIWIGNHHYFKGEHNLASKQYDEVVDLALQINYIDGIANGYYGQASILNDQEQILQQHLRIDSLYEANGSVSAVLANSYGAIGDIYFRSYGNQVEAKKYYDKALETAQKAQYLPGITYLQNVLGDIAMASKDYQLASRYYQDLYDHYELRKDTVFMAHSILDLADLSLQQGNWERCRQQLQQALDYYYYLKDTTAMGNSHTMFARLYTAMGYPDKVRPHIDSASMFPNLLDLEDHQIDIMEIEVGYSQLIGDFKTAFYQQKQLDSLNSLKLQQQNGAAFMELEQRYQAQEREQAIALLTIQNNLIEQRSKTQKLMFIGGAVLLLLALLGLWGLYRNKQKTNLRLRELDQAKSNFLANISHEFRTPLTLISAPVEDLLENKNLSSQERTAFQMIQRNQHRLLNLVDQLLDLSKIEAGSMKLRITLGNITQFLSLMMEPFEYLAQQSNRTFTIELTNTQDDCWFDEDALEKIVSNLLSNAFKHSSEEGVIKLKAKVVQDNLRLEVLNQATALSEVQSRRIFDKFYQLDNDQPGAGIGLALVRDLVALHGGSIEVKNMAPDWVVFSVVLPVHRNNFKENQLVAPGGATDTSIAPVRIQSSTKLAETKDGVDWPILLVVEDNVEVLQLLVNTFEHKYQIITAANGDEGVNQAVQQIPDLIISDVMMPLKDGVELTTTLKSDERTSHIPIILLTAKASEEHQLQGVESGADDYITKPFSTKLLQAKVNSLINLRNELRNRYQQELVLRPKEIAITPLDEQFLNKVQVVLDQLLVEPSFTVERFSTELALSRMQLHRKLKALTGLSASEFIRSQRLKMAASLLKDSDQNISQIGYAVGFNDPSYFARCFKDEFQCTPSEFAEQHV